MAEQKGGTPLRMLVEKIMVLTLPIFPRREEKMRYHLVEECGVVSGVSFFHGKVGLQPGDVSERFSEKELSMMDFLYLSPELNDEVAQNIAENHLAMIRHAYEEESGARHVLFMEDDARVDREVFSAEQSRWLRHFLERSDTDMLHLGCMPFSAGLYRYPYVMQNLSMTLCAHAYVLTRRGMARFWRMRRSIRLCRLIGCFMTPGSVSTPRTPWCVSRTGLPRCTNDSRRSSRYSIGCLSERYPPRPLIYPSSCRFSP